MTLPKIKPCPMCAGVAGEQVGEIEYDSGWKYVECYRCNYTSGGHGRFVQAIRDWNSRERWPVSYIGAAPQPQTAREES